MNEKQALMGQIGQLKNQSNVVIQQDNTDFDAIINQYKHKNAMLNDELARLQSLLVQNNNEINTLKMRESKTVNVIKQDDSHFRQEIDLLNRRISDLKAENDKYQVLLRNAKTTEKVIVKEIAQPQVSQTVSYHQEPVKTVTYHQEPIKTYHETKTTYQAPSHTTYHQAPIKTIYEPLKTEMKQVSYLNDAPVQQNYNYKPLIESGIQKSSERRSVGKRIISLKDNETRQVQLN